MCVFKMSKLQWQNVYRLYSCQILINNYRSYLLLQTHYKFTSIPFISLIFEQKVPTKIMWFHIKKKLLICASSRPIQDCRWLCGVIVQKFTLTGVCFFFGKKTLYLAQGKISSQGSFINDSFGVGTAKITHFYHVHKTLPAYVNRCLRGPTYV